MSDQLRHKIQQWEASPPPGAWANIAVAIQDVHAENILSERLSQQEETPPPAIWAAVLDEIQPKAQQTKPVTPVIPLHPLYPYLFRYGAVALVAGLTAWFLIGNPFWEKTVQNSTASTTKSPATEIPASAQGKPAIATAITGIPENNAATVQPEEIILSNNLPAREPQYTVVQPITKPVKEPAMVARLPKFQQPPYLYLQELPVQKTNQRYITIYSASGEPIRLSAKFAPLYYAMEQGTENGPQTAASLLQKMQVQMTRRPYIPDPNNHFDMIRLVDLLQQKQ